MSAIIHPKDTVFLGHRFHPLTLVDKDMLQDYLRRYPQHVSGVWHRLLFVWCGLSPR